MPKLTFCRNLRREERRKTRRILQLMIDKRREQIAIIDRMKKPFRDDINNLREALASRTALENAIRHTEGVSAWLSKWRVVTA